MSRPVTPLIAADCVIRLRDHDDCIVLIERANPPYGLALPGGFVEIDETVEATALREAGEETGLQVTLTTLLGLYSAPGRDPRGATASAVYIAEAGGNPRAGDDAAAAFVVDPRQQGLRLAFDHGLILADYLRWLETGLTAPLRRGPVLSPDGGDAPC